MIMNPIWLMVEYARIFLMSDCVADTTAAKSAVAAPTTAITAIAAGASTSRGLRRTRRNGPAFTIVAACISADTGVGASIANGSQTWNGAGPTCPWLL